MTAIAVDAGGKAYVTGNTDAKNNAQFNVTSGAFQTSNSGSKVSGFLRVYDTALSGAASLLYSTFLGGNTGTGPNNGDLPSGISIDSLGRAVIVGRTDTSDFPVTGDAYSSVNTSSGGDGAMFLVVLNPGGGGNADLVYGTFFGSASSSGAVAMSGGKAVFVGTTNTNGLATAGSLQPARAGGSDAIIASFTIVPATNTAPVITGANTLAGVLEDPVANPGTLVSSLIVGRVTDPDAGALAGIAITGLVMTNGAWQYSLNGGTSWNAFTAPSAAVATLLNADALTRVRFVPNANFNGTVSGGLSFRAWDRTSGTAGATANTTSNGGVTAYSSGLASADVTVASVNDAPVRTGGTVSNLTAAENSGLSTLGLGSLAYGPGGGADEAAQILSYTVTAVPAATLGTIVLADGATVVSAATSYSLAQLQGMQFKATANANGGPATFSWSVTDSGGVANSGINTLGESLSVTVTPALVSTPAVPSAAAPVPPVTAPVPLAVLTPVPLVAPPPLNPLAIQPVATSGAGVRSGGVAAGGADSLAQANAENGDVGAPSFTQSTSQPSAVSGAPLTPVSFVSGERRGFALAPQPVAGLEFGQFNLQAGGVPLSPQEVERSLRSPAMLEQLDRMREEIRKDLNLEHTVAITAAGATFGVSVIYVLWLIRGGILMGSYLSALPAWQVLDPLPVLERLKNPADEEDDSFEEFENPRADPLQSLRGY